MEESFVTKQTLIGDLVQEYPCTVPMLNSIGMECINCPSSRYETLEQACGVHGLEPDVIERALNLRIRAAKAKGEA